MPTNRSRWASSSGIRGSYLTSTGTKPGSSSLKVFVGCSSASGWGISAWRFETPCRRRPRSRPERETAGLRNSRVTASRSSRGRSKVLRNSTTTSSWAGVSVVCRRWGRCVHPDRYHGAAIGAPWRGSDGTRAPVRALTGWIRAVPGGWPGWCARSYADSDSWFAGLRSVVALVLRVAGRVRLTASLRVRRTSRAKNNG